MQTRQKSNLKRLVAALLLAMLFTTIFPLQIFATAGEPAPDTAAIQQLISDKLISHGHLARSASSIERIRDVKDFSGNSYTLVECTPAGYYILDPATGQFPEYSIEDVSPYLNCTGELYYGGPSSFFEYLDGQYTHVFEKSLVLSEEDVAYMAQQSNTLKDYLATNAAEESTTRAIQYPNYITNYQYLMYAGAGYDFEGGAWSQGYLYEVSPGYCGYIAGNLLMFYWQIRLGGNYVAAGRYSIYGLEGPALTKELVSIGKSIGYGAATTPNTIASVLKQYQKQQGFGGTVGYSFTGSAGVMNELRNNRPSILFGYLNDPDGQNPINHAVTVYGHYNDGSLIVNYGWPKQSCAVINGPVYAGNTYYVP